MMKYNPGKRMAAIGDGGNDVCMIQAAHVGLGIVGKEGRHASLAADFSITQFHHCKSLILWHGRGAYLRSATLSQFIFHRGIIISIIQAIFSSIFYFASIPIFTGWLMVGYTTCFTMFPTFSLVLDEDVTETTVLAFPELYSDLQKGRALNLKTFLFWVWQACCQGGIIVLLAVWLFEESFVRIVSITFTSLISTELVLVFLTMHNHTKLAIYVAQLISIGSYILSIVLLPTYFDVHFMTTRTFVAKVFIIVFSAVFPFAFAKHLHARIYPPQYKKLRRHSEHRFQLSLL
jgi:phospholipid-translocating ATPase